VRVARIPLIPLAIGAGIAVGLGAFLVRKRRALMDKVRRPRLEELTKDELYQRARAADIHGRSEMTKDELVRALRSAA